MTIQERVEERAEKIFKICYGIDGWKWENISKDEQNIWYDIARQTLIWEVEARIKEHNGITNYFCNAEGWGTRYDARTKQLYSDLAELKEPSNG